jgi:hypothetical protein
MFKSIYLITGEEIVILDPRWREQIAQLRSLASQDQLVCQGCRQPVRVRVPRFRRAHYAHKHLHNCTFGQASPELLQARAVLYEWLLTQFGARETGKALTLEKAPGETQGIVLPRPVDGWVEMGEKTFAYWIVETRLHLDDRQRLLAWAERSGAQVHWVFLSSLLHEAEEQPGKVYLSTTERAFLAPSEYETAGISHSLTAPGSLRPEVPGSLHYLDAELGSVTTFRGLRLAHAPQVFTGQKEQTLLSRVVASPRTGEFTHPGESERASRHRLGQEERERREAERLRRFADLQERLARRASPEGPSY